ncbi:DUF2726 domain-containing protein [Ramlibacter aquaticus]|uniref:DUF2726 domain-containing protein n=1 Tax=Ramlibacter aquaticus TaxID=2780094 RepID=A0ABR9SKD4_9BURK|nr:DUF2726 domain-containing protein [Ramlibacter aquaticus]MBE7942831.1 DUF2726 domain-containing protein [Ramlibacter aquaticus]
MIAHEIALVGPSTLACEQQGSESTRTRRREGSGNADVKFKPKALLTANELEFLGRLEAAAPELRFCPQVSMRALLEPAIPRKDGKAYFQARGMFSQKIVDFVAQRRSGGAIVAIVELDDRTHDGGKDAKRDAMLASAGYRVLRWQSRAKPDVAAIRAELQPPPQSSSASSTALRQ